MLLKLLIIASNEADPHEELLLNVIAASTNISYYASINQVCSERSIDVRLLVIVNIT